MKPRIEDVVIRELNKCPDKRGWLAECFRSDELPKRLLPEMAYVSMTLPGVSRGPHEHFHQTDYFVFFSSNFQIYLWDNREDSPTYRKKMALKAGKTNPAIIIVPPRIVHAYRNIGTNCGLVLNFPNRLYAGKGKQSKVDEVRYENDKNSAFKI